MASKTQTVVTAPSSAGRELLLELKRYQRNTNGQLSSSLPSTLPTYNVKLVRKCLDDLENSVQRLSEEVQAATMMDNSTTKKPSMASRPSILWHHACIQRQKRCLLAYHKHRLEGIKAMALFEANDATTNAGGSASKLTNAAEMDFFESYQQLREDYYQQALGMDLATTLMSSSSLSAAGHALGSPPASQHSIQVRCIAEASADVVDGNEDGVVGGPVVLESGRSITFTKGSLYYLPRSDVVEFIQQGILEVVEGEEAIEF